MLLDLFATGFSLFICSIFDRNTNLVATGISVVTCILAGCFIPFSVNNSIVSGLLNFVIHFFVISVRFYDFTKTGSERRLLKRGNNKSSKCEESF